jgi:predicted dehydrogenase
MTANVCRWGILGTAGIAKKHWRGMRVAEGATITAVASRTLAAAQQFIDQCSAAVPYPNPVAAVAPYEALLDREDVDAVYIPLPTALRHHWVIRAAEAGKHVLAEKPAACDAVQVKEMLHACRQHKVQYMDGVMFMHSARLPLVRQLLDNPNTVGKLRRMASQFSFCGNAEFRTHNIRVDSRLEPHGCLGDLGWYCIRFFLWVMQGKLPISVRARMLSTLHGAGSPVAVPGEFSAELIFPGGVSASFYNSFVTENQQWMHISGERGNLALADFVLPYHGAEIAATLTQDVFRVDNCDFHMEHHQQRHAVSEYSSAFAGAQEIRLIETFVQLVRSGQLSEVWPQWTLTTQQVLDACWQSATNDGKTIELEV